MKRKSAAALCALFLVLSFPPFLRAFDVEVDTRVTGRWLSENDGAFYTFNADGSASVESEAYTGVDVSFVAVDGIIMIGASSFDGRWDSASYAISDDGKTMLISSDGEGVWLHKNSRGGGIDTRIAGTWLNKSGNSVISFAADGKGVVKEEDGRETGFSYRAVGGILVMFREDGEGAWDGVFYALSGDGTTLILDSDGTGTMLTKSP